MKTEFVDVSDTRKQLARGDSEHRGRRRDRPHRPRLRQGRPDSRVPARARCRPRSCGTRFRDQILHDVAHDLIPRAVDNALRERGVEPVDTPDIKNVLVEEGQPLKFTADFETVPAFDPGDYGALNLTKPAASVTDDAVAETLERLRQRAARYEPVEGRPVEAGDTVVVDLVREAPGEAADRHENVSIEIGASANPPGLRRPPDRPGGRRREALPGRLPGRLQRQGIGGHGGALRRHGEGHQDPRGPGARRRVRQGPGRVRQPRGAARARARGPAARTPSGPPSASCATTCCGSWPAG